MIVPVILSGGSGSRLWPVSREGCPKPFMRLADGESLLEKTYRRALLLQEALYPLERPAEMITVTNRDYYFMSRDEQDAAGVNGQFMLEPVGRNTAPAVALAAHAVVHDFGADSVMLVLPADHLILDQAAFESAVAKAKSLAENDHLVTFGVLPTGAETGFGYIERGPALSSGFAVKQFVEKPDLKTAERYVESGDFYWNSGMFCFKAGVFLHELARHAPDIAELAGKCWSEMSVRSRLDMREIPVSAFADVPDISVDYAVMERSARVAVVPGDFGWSDIGSWTAVRDLIPADAAGNRVVGDVIMFDTENTFVQSQDRLVATVGVNNLMIVDTPDALLVVSPDKSQEVRKIVAELKRGEHDAHRLHKTVSRPWGTFTVLEESQAFKIKRIEVKPGASLSLQMHEFRSEHWVVVSGLAKVTNGDDEIMIRPNESTYIPAGHKHRLSNPGSVNCVLIEVQCGVYLGEDDIVRFDDVYGRGEA